MSPIFVHGVQNWRHQLKPGDRVQLEHNAFNADRRGPSRLHGRHVHAHSRSVRSAIAQKATCIRVADPSYSCAKHLTVESYTVVMLLTVILIIISIPSPTHSFIPGLIPSFYANPSHRSLSFSSFGLIELHFGLQSGSDSESGSGSESGSPRTLIWTAMRFRQPCTIISAILTRPIFLVNQSSIFQTNKQ